MKKLLLAALVIAPLTAFATTPERGDNCKLNGAIAATDKGHLLSCVDGKLEYVQEIQSNQAVTTVADQNVQISVRLMEGEKLVKMQHLISQDGKASPIEISREQSYIAQATKEGDKVAITPGTVKSGLFLAFTPTIQKNGHINVAFSAKISDINSIQTFKQEDGMEVQLPQVTSSDLKGSIEVADGKEVSVPFGPSNPGNPIKTKYTLKLVVTKG